MINEGKKKGEEGLGRGEDLRMYLLISACTRRWCDGPH